MLCVQVGCHEGCVVLIRFEVSNFRSILQPVELSLVAVDRGRDAVRPVPNLGESLLPVAAIFGPNASGKSNILAALSWLRSAVRDSLRMWDDEIPLEPFAFTDGSALSEFTVECVISGVRFEYVVELDRTPFATKVSFTTQRKSGDEYSSVKGYSLRCSVDLAVCPALVNCSRTEHWRCRLPGDSTSPSSLSSLAIFSARKCLARTRCGDVRTPRALCLTSPLVVGSRRTRLGCWPCCVWLTSASTMLWSTSDGGNECISSIEQPVGRCRSTSMPSPRARKPGSR